MTTKQYYSYILNTIFIVDLILFMCMLWMCYGAWVEEERALDCTLWTNFQLELFERRAAKYL